VQVQPPAEQLETMQRAPAPQASSQFPPEQLTVHVPPFGHDVLQ
jgi:hypothetical protein